MNGVGVAAQFNSPTGIAVDTNGLVYVCDNGNNVVRTVASSGVNRKKILVLLS